MFTLIFGRLPKKPDATYEFQKVLVNTMNRILNNKLDNGEISNLEWLQQTSKNDKSLEDILKNNL